jgi:beta-glucanase (GH16 family)
MMHRSSYTWNGFLHWRGAVLACVLMGGLVCGTGVARGAWQLSWSDEFDGSSINATNWTYETGNGRDGWGNNELEYYTSRPQNAYVSNGILHIVALKEAYSGFHYTSAKIRTHGLFSQKYGRFEFRARLPQGKGYWPALWMMPEDSVYGRWPTSGEIDVMENRGGDQATVLGTIHFGSSSSHAQSFGPPYTFPSGDSVTNFHVYAVEWSGTAVSWYVDGNLYETQKSWWSSGGPHPAPFDQPFYIIINLAVGGNFGGSPDGTTVFPGDMQVDYVRAYNWVSAPPVPAIQKSASGLFLNWPYGLLQSAPSATGSWSGVAGAASPFAMAPMGQQQLYRTREP